MYSTDFKPRCVVLKSYTDQAHQLSCIRCGNTPAMPCHYTGMCQHWYGKGRGIKCTDLAIVDLCHDCHQEFDNLQIGKHEECAVRQLEQSEEFLHYVFLTIHRRLELGLVLYIPNNLAHQPPL